MENNTPYSDEVINAMLDWLRDIGIDTNGLTAAQVVSYVRREYDGTIHDFIRAEGL